MSFIQRNEYNPEIINIYTYAHSNIYIYSLVQTTG